LRVPVEAKKEGCPKLSIERNVAVVYFERVRGSQRQAGGYRIQQTGERSLLSISDGLRRAFPVLALAGLASAAGIWYLAIRTPPIPRRVLRIGYEQVPPVQLRGENGPSGLAIETVAEAAKRAGIALEWVETGTSSEEAFRRGLVDLWPIMADLPDRRKFVHISKPWLHTSHTLVLRQGTPTPDASFTGRIAVFKMPLHVRLIGGEFPAAQLIQFPDMRDMVKEVCTGTVSAGFMEDRAALMTLRDRPAECGSTALRVEALPNLTMPVGVASTFQAAGAADKIRGEIDVLFRDGTLAATMAKYSYYGLDSTWNTYDLIEAAERARWVAWGVSALGIVLCVTFWQTASLLQRKRSEAALRVSEERFRAIFDQAAVGDAQVTLEGEVTLVNDRYCEVLGYPREELAGRSLVDKAHPDDCEAVLANRRRLLEGEARAYAMEMRSVRKDGGITWLKLHESLVRDESGQPQCSIAVVEDVTERRHAEAALQESERRFRSMADTAPVMIWVSGRDGFCTFFSQGWLSFTGSTMDQALGTGWSRRIHPEDRDRCYANYSSAFDARHRFQTECRLQRADGEYRWVLATGAPRFEASGAFAGYIGTCTDITEVKRSQDEALARQKLEGLGVLAGGIAHDFNNLLGSILTTSELVRSELPNHSPAHDGLDSIKTVADRAAAIVRQMMAYAGQEKTVLEPVNLSALVHEMLQLLHVSISKRAQLRVDLPEDLPPVRANSAQIRQVVMNLITNASEALGENDGVISIALAHLRSDPGPTANGVSGRAPTDAIRLTVSDTGSGMTEAIQTRIFDPFFTTKFPGRGMGLAALQGIIRDHGGTIQVVSTPGQGSRFEVLLPCTSRAEREIRDGLEPASSGADAGVTLRVLLVEDEDELRVAVSKMLRKRGFAVVEADDGRAGMDLFRANAQEIDVVLLDLTLPGMTGREVLEELRRLRPDVKVVITTAYGQDMAQKELGGQQAWFYIRKPYRATELAEMLREVCLSEGPDGGSTRRNAPGAGGASA
jgi:two-component system, cell cycle sensor histidine kinase and response regulator CckA